MWLGPRTPVPPVRVPSTKLGSTTVMPLLPSPLLNVRPPLLKHMPKLLPLMLVHWPTTTTLSGTMKPSLSPTSMLKNNLPYKTFGGWFLVSLNSDLEATTSDTASLCSSSAATPRQIASPRTPLIPTSRHGCTWLASSFLSPDCSTQSL